MIERHARVHVMRSVLHDVVQKSVEPPRKLDVHGALTLVCIVTLSAAKDRTLCAESRVIVVSAIASAGIARSSGAKFVEVVVQARRIHGAKLPPNGMRRSRGGVSP